MNFQVTLLKVLASYPDGFAVTEEISATWPSWRPAVAIAPTGPAKWPAGQMQRRRKSGVSRRGLVLQFSEDSIPVLNMQHLSCEEAIEQILGLGGIETEALKIHDPLFLFCNVERALSHVPLSLFQVTKLHLAIHRERIELAPAPCLDRGQAFKDFDRLPDRIPRLAKR